MPIMNISLAFAFIANFILAFVVVFKNYKSRANIYFSLFTFISSFWIISLFFLFSFSNKFAGSLSFVFASFLPPLLYLFSLNFPQIEKRSFLSLIFRVLFFLLTIIFTASAFLNLIFSDIIFYDHSAKILSGIAYLPFVSYLALSTIFVFGRLWKKYRNSSGLQKIQLRYFFWGTFTFAFFA